MDYDNLNSEQLEQLATTVFSPNKPLNLGPFILGNAIDALLCGMMLIQCGSYIGSSTRDGWPLRLTVGYVMVMNLWGTGLAWVCVWDVFVRNFGVYRTLLSVTYLSFDFLVSAMGVFVVQSFFALRAWKVLNRSRLFAAVVIVFTPVPLGSGIAIKILASNYKLATFADKIKAPAYTCLSSMVFVDILITSTILFYLLRWRGSSEQSDHLLSKLLRITFESQLPPTLIAVALLVIYTIKHDSFIMVPLIWIQPKLYGISLLHTLNMRKFTAQPPIIFGTSYSMPSHITSSRDMAVISIEFKQVDSRSLSPDTDIDAAESKPDNTHTDEVV